MWLTQLQRKIAALGNFHTVLQCFRQVGKQRRHFGLRLEILLRGKMAHAPLVVQHIAFGDAHARLVRLEIVYAEELHRMRRHHRQPEFRRELQRLAQMRFLACKTVALHLQIIASRKQPGIFLRQLTRCCSVAIQQCRAHFAEMRSRQCNQAIGALA